MLLAKTLKKKLKNTQLFWTISKPLLGRWYSRKIDKLPPLIVIESTNICNLKCPACPTMSTMKRRKGNMEFSLFKTLIDEFVANNYRPKIFLNFSGEPTINRELPEFIKYATDRNFWVHLSTNVTYMTEELSTKIIKSGLNHVYLCMDGFTKEAHEAYRIGSKFENVKANIEQFLRKRKELGSTLPFVEIQTLITSKSQDHIEPILDWAKNIGADAVYFRGMILDLREDKSRREANKKLLPNKIHFDRNPNNIKKSVCTNPINQGLIYYNGDLGLCCCDYDANIVEPVSILEQGFINTYLSNKWVKQRRKGLLREPDACKNCVVTEAQERGLSYSKDTAFLVPTIVGGVT